MRAEKKFITQEYLARLNASPFFIVVDYRGLSVTQFTEFRRRLARVGAEAHVVKNSIFRAAAKEAGVGELAGSLEGQLAVITGRRDVSAAAKAAKTFQAEFDKPKLRFGYLGNQRLESRDLAALAELPSLEVLRARLLGTLQAPAQNLVRLLNTPATQLAQVLRAWKEKQETAAAA
jgi:large subunit ribosomal protein L10